VSRRGAADAPAADAGGGGRGAVEERRTRMLSLTPTPPPPPPPPPTLSAANMDAAAEPEMVRDLVSCGRGGRGSGLAPPLALGPGLGLAASPPSLSAISSELKLLPPPVPPAPAG